LIGAANRRAAHHRARVHPRHGRTARARGDTAR
jgi:hypothetical protein